MFTRTVTFEKCPVFQQVPYICSGCGKNRMKTFRTIHTINPFNKNDDGSVRSREQVYAKAREENDKKITEFKSHCQLCTKCTELAAKMKKEHSL